MSTGDTVSAGRRTTSTPSISGSVAPASTASNISWQCGDGVWWTISRRGTSDLHPMVQRIQSTPAFATTLSTTNASAGHTVLRPRLDDLHPWDVKNCADVQEFPRDDDCDTRRGRSVASLGTLSEYRVRAPKIILVHSIRD